MSILVDAAIRSPNTYIWAAPTYDQSRTGMDETRRALGGIAAFNESRMTATLPTGGQILYRSLDRPENLRGKTAAGVVIDEAAESQPEGWYEVLRPMLIDTGGWAYFIYTPKGRNWVWQDWQKSTERKDTALFHAPTLGVEVADGKLARKPHPLENPFIPFDEVVNLWQTMPERSFRQEILAEFIEDGGGVFRNVRASATAPPASHRRDGRYYFGVDWGRSNDYTVIDCINAVTGEQVAHERFTDIGYQVQVNRLVGLYERWKPETILAESNSMGAPLIEQLQGLGLPVTGFHTDNASKKQIIEGLQLAFERGKLRILNDETAISELEAYEQETLRSGLIRYSAPEGLHDDCVMALALAWHAAMDTGEGFAFSYMN